MKLLAWNVGHRTKQKPIPPQMPPALNSLEPDVVVLTEYVHGSQREPFIAELAEHGLMHHLVTPLTPGHNQVLIASRTRLERGSILAPPLDPALPSNVLHVRLPDSGLELLGLRVPWYVGKDATEKKNRCWDWIVETAGTVVDTPFIMLGDFNTDVERPRAKVIRIGRLVSQGWQHALPQSGASYYGNNGSTSRIDHAFVSQHFAVRSAEYVPQRDPYTFSGHGSDKFSDHAPLLVEIEAIVIAQVPSG